MTNPIVFISHSTVKDGELEALEEASRSIFPALEADKPETVLHYGYTNEAGTEVHFIHAFPNADAMDAHFVGAAERSAAAAEFIDTYQFEIYGAPSAEALSMLRSAGVDVAIRSEVLGGYIRLAAN